MLLHALLPVGSRSRLAVLFSCLLLGILVQACSSSSPRFKGRGSSSSTETTASDQQRFATKARQEETAEDDRKVDMKDVQGRFAKPLADTPGRGSSIDRKRVITEVLGLIGTPYVLGGNSTDGMDCSAFTAHIYGRAIDRTLPRTTEDQHKVGQPVRGKLRFGDLVFFNTMGQSPSHVGIFIGDDLFAHASVSFGVTISSLQSSYYKKRYIGARRVAE
jgi:cell wall-associated NlpC family hydrolase